MATSLSGFLNIKKESHTTEYDITIYYKRVKSNLGYAVMEFIWPHDEGFRVNGASKITRSKEI